MATEDDDAEADRTAKASKPVAKAVAPATAPKTYAPAPAPAVGSAPALTPFGDCKGQPLSSLPLESSDRSVKFGDLKYFATKWQPKPYGDNPNPSAKDLAVKAEAVRLWNASQGGSAESTDSIPF